MRKFFGTIGKILLVGFLIGIPATLVYLDRVGLDAGLRTKISAALSSPSRTVTFERLTFNPFEGVVAKNVTIVLPETSDRKVAKISRISIALNLAALFARQIQIDALSLEDADLAIPFADDDVQPDAIYLENVRAKVLASQDEIQIPDATFQWNNVRVKLVGSIIHPQSFALTERKKQTPEEIAERVKLIRSALDEFDQIRFTNKNVELSVNVSVDLDDVKSLKVSSMSLKSGGFTIRGIAFDALNLSGSYAQQNITLKRFTLAGSSADISAHGTWSPAEGKGFFRFAGGADPSAFYPLMAPDTLPDIAEEVSFEEMPRIEGIVTGDPESGFRATGTLNVGGFSVKEVRGKSITTDFAWQPGSWYVQNAVITLQTGTINADALSTDQDLRIRLNSNINPTEIESVTGPNERKILDELEFKDNPTVAVELTGHSANLKELAGSGTLELGRTAMRGSWIDAATSKLRFQDRAVHYDDIALRKGDQRAQGGFIYDFGRKEVRLEKVVSNLMPIDVLLWIDPRIAKTVEPYKFRGFPNVEADGLVHMKDPSQNSLVIEVEAKGGLNYDLINKTLPIGETRGTITLLGQSVNAKIPRAELFGGNVDVNANVSVDPNQPIFGATVVTSNIDFPSLTELYFKYSRSKGVMNGKYEFTSHLREPGSMNGKGSITVQNGHVMNIPLFGPLSEVLNAIIPGVGHESAKLASADFQIANQKVTTENLQIEGDGFLLYGDGAVAYPSGKLDLTVRINAQGLPGVVLFPVSKLFEYVSTGTMSDPQWRPKVIPKEFFQILGEPVRVLNSVVSPEPNATPPPSNGTTTSRPPRTGGRRGGR